MVDLAQARNIRVDRAVDAYFAEALTRIQDAQTTTPPRPGRKVAVAGSAQVVAVSVPMVAIEPRPAPRLIWALDPNPKPRPVRPVLRRYAVNAMGIELVADWTARVMARAGSAAVRASVAAWQAMTENDPAAWV